MTKLFAVLLAGFMSSAVFAASHAGAPNMPEAMKSGDAKAQDAAQSKTDAKPKGKDGSAMQPEAMKQGDAKAQAAAEAKKKAAVGKKNSTDEQMGADAKKL